MLPAAAAAWRRAGVHAAVPAGQPQPLAPAAPSGVAAPDWQLVVLGIAQDGGMPHPGCHRSPCTEARAGQRRPEKVACIGLVDRASGASYVFDATPDMPAQIEALNGGRPPDGIFLTHAHIGHYTGLMYLGKEAWATRGVPVYGTHRMIGFLKANGPWSLLVSDRHIDTRAIEPDRAVALPRNLRVTALTVPHRDEFSDTVGYVIEGPRARVLFVPDTDRWETWPRPIRALVDTVDHAFLDGTFSSPEEIGGRDLTAIPHPMMAATRERLRGTKARLWFVHLNHTNPALVGGADDVAREGMRLAV